MMTSIGSKAVCSYKNKIWKQKVRKRRDKPGIKKTWMDIGQTAKVNYREENQ